MVGEMLAAPWQPDGRVGKWLWGLGARGPTTALGEAKLDVAHVFLGGNGACFVFLM